MSSGLYEKELQEYYNSPEYVRAHETFFKKDCRKKAVIQKVRQFQKKNTDFTIADKRNKKNGKTAKLLTPKTITVTA